MAGNEPMGQAFPCNGRRYVRETVRCRFRKRLAAIPFGDAYMLKKLRKLMIRCGVILLGLVVLFLCWSYQLELPFREAEAHLAKHEHVVQTQARALIDSCQGDSTRSIDSADLPASLAVPHLRFVQVRETHLNLVISTNPDATSGFRVWVSPRPDDHEDRSTSIPFVERFHYSSDAP